MLYTVITINPQKINTNLTIDEDLLNWVDENIRGKRFASRSHAVNYALFRIKAESQGTPRTNPERFWTVDENGEDIIPDIQSGKDLGKTIYPDYPREQMRALSDWFSHEQNGGYWIYQYHKTVGRINLFIRTDKSQKVFDGRVDADFTEFIRRIPSTDEWSRVSNVGGLRKDGQGFDMRKSPSIRIKEPIQALEDLAYYMIKYAEMIQAPGTQYIQNEGN
jgi:Arc/MetJ-type ribon-helix-helix transcriptional regulator